MKYGKNQNVGNIDTDESANTCNSAQTVLCKAGPTHESKNLLHLSNWSTWKRHFNRDSYKMIGYEQPSVSQPVPSMSRYITQSNLLSEKKHDKKLKWAW